MAEMKMLGSSSGVKGKDRVSNQSSRGTVLVRCLEVKPERPDRDGLDSSCGGTVSRLVEGG